MIVGVMTWQVTMKEAVKGVMVGGAVELGWEGEEWQRVVWQREMTQGDAYLSKGRTMTEKVSPPISSGSHLSHL